MQALSAESGKTRVLPHRYYSFVDHSKTSGDMYRVTFETVTRGGKLRVAALVLSVGTLTGLGHWLTVIL